MTEFALQADRIFNGDQFLENHAVVVEQNRISAVTARSELPSDMVVENLGSGVLAPGFIDWQVNGGGGVLFNNDTTVNGIRRILRGHYQGGTTGLLPTLISDTQSARGLAVMATRAAIAEGEQSVLGLHLEGPYFAAAKRGTHHEAFMASPSDAEIAWLIDNADLPLLVTLAPEVVGCQQIQRLSDAGVIVCAGHTNADAATVNKALRAGLRGFTHLYNAMRPATGREPGVVGAALVDRQAWCGIIADGHHVHADMIRLAWHAKPTGKLCLVSDAMATVGGVHRSFELYGQTITERDGRLLNSEGNLAGSAITMIDAVRIAHQLAGIELGEVLRMASLYPAEFLRQPKLGLVKPGYRADLVHFNSEFQVQQTWVAGQAKLPSNKRVLS
ncbi:N-acetylglucosamine-6-phosphate deacetylase [Arenicella chitinivorans]|uniref:N-acetylglucosamine-6-phosphate deacetylase n=1 Tax=Arenicella chitinivorans TaxID=1329800 RepID=A0A918RK43_9GAMM|nr:N-acetylglucosamine-6-phosphate deacetylase [Arenicella chitinivorans]GGZ98051.1 N-acetylglucosamine-6-phosphate deacetylase [Arenicella chitinivorans]